MRAADVERVLVSVTGATPSEIDQRTRWLRKFKHPGLRAFRAGRGRHAPHLDEWEAAFMLLCLAARKATDAQKVARWVAGHRIASDSFRPAPRSSGAVALTEYITRVTDKKPTEVPFIYILGMIIAKAVEGEPFNIRSIDVSGSGSLVWITFVDNSRLLIGDEDLMSATTEEKSTSQQTTAKDRFFVGEIEYRLIISATFLQKLSKQLAARPGGVMSQPTSQEKG